VYVPLKVAVASKSSLHSVSIPSVASRDTAGPTIASESRAPPRTLRPATNELRLTTKSELPSTEPEVPTSRVTRTHPVCRNTRAARTIPTSEQSSPMKMNHSVPHLQFRPLTPYQFHVLLNSLSVICKTDHHPKDVKQLRRGWCDHISMSSRSGRGKRSIAAIPVNCAN